MAWTDTLAAVVKAVSGAAKTVNTIVPPASVGAAVVKNPDGTPLAISELEQAATTAAALFSHISAAIKGGGVSGAVSVTEDVLQTIGVAFPPAAQMNSILHTIQFLAPLARSMEGPSIPDGKGGSVPESWGEPGSGMHLDKNGNFIP